LARADGSPVSRTAAQRSYEQFMIAVRAAGGRAPLGSDGYRQVWNDVRGWHDRSETGGMGGYGSSEAGDGWRVCASHFAHYDLEQLARQVWRVAFPWSGGFPAWTPRFGELTGRHADFSAVTLYGPKLIIIDEAKLLRAQDLEADLRESLLHEAAHIACGVDEDEHSHLFHVTLNDARARCPRVIGTWTRATR